MINYQLYHFPRKTDSSNFLFQNSSSREYWIFLLVCTKKYTLGSDHIVFTTCWSLDNEPLWHCKLSLNNEQSIAQTSNEVEYCRDFWLVICRSKKSMTISTKLNNLDWNEIELACNGEQLYQNVQKIDIITNI